MCSLFSVPSYTSLVGKLKIYFQESTAAGILEGNYVLAVAGIQERFGRWKPGRGHNPAAALADKRGPGDVSEAARGPGGVFQSLLSSSVGVRRELWCWWWQFLDSWVELLHCVPVSKFLLVLP